MSKKTSLLIRTVQQWIALSFVVSCRVDWLPSSADWCCWHRSIASESHNLFFIISTKYQNNRNSVFMNCELAVVRPCIWEDDPRRALLGRLPVHVNAGMVLPPLQGTRMQFFDRAKMDTSNKKWPSCWTALLSSDRSISLKQERMSDPEGLEWPQKYTSSDFCFN